MEIEIRFLTGKTLSLEVTPHTTIYALKLKIEYEEGYRPEQQRILFQGKVLSDGRTLAFYNVEQGDVLHIFTIK